MHAVREKDHPTAGRRINPEARAGESGVTEGANRKQIASIARELRVDVPAEAAHRSHAWRRLRRGHRSDAGAAQHANAVELTVTDQHADKALKITRGAEQAGMTGHAPHAAGGRVVHHTP